MTDTHPSGLGQSLEEFRATRARTLALAEGLTQAQLADILSDARLPGGPDTARS